MNTTNEEASASQETKWATCKEVAAEYGCAESTVKRWAKGNKVRKEQQGERQPYLVNPEEIRQVLENTPQVASVFHPKDNTTPTQLPPGSEDEVVETQPEPRADTPDSAPDPASPIRERVTRPQPRRTASKADHRGRTKKPQKLNLATVLNQARRLRLEDKVRLKNELGRLIDAA
ncbi:MAG: hypothetical protein ACSHYB_07900 [Roseibacillus sp.]